MHKWLRWLYLLVLTPLIGSSDPPAKTPGLADLPVGITSFGATFHEGAIYVFGGQLGRAHQYNRDDVSKPLFRLEYADGAKWESLPTDEPALGPSILSHKSGIIRIGGMQPRNAKGEEAEMVSVPYVRRFDPQSNTWSKLPDLPRGRSSHDAWIDGDKIYVAGGWQMRGLDQSSRWARTVEVIDLSEETPQWRQIPQPFSRRALAIAIVDEKLFCLGGLDNGGEVSTSVDILDLKTESWSKGSDLPEDSMIGFGTAAGVEAENDQFFITGFSGNIYHLKAESVWQKAGQFASGRMFARFVDPPNGPPVIIGGAEKGGRPKALEHLPIEN